LQGGCNPNLSGDEGLDDDEEDDSTWRTLRLERETWLKEKVKYILFIFALLKTM